MQVCKPQVQNSDELGCGKDGMYLVLLSLTSDLSASPPLVCPRAPTYTPTGTNTQNDLTLMCLGGAGGFTNRGACLWYVLEFSRRMMDKWLCQNECVRPALQCGDID